MSSSMCTRIEPNFGRVVDATGHTVPSMQDASRGAFDLVYAEALDRVSRDQEDVAASATVAVRQREDYDARRR